MLWLDVRVRGHGYGVTAIILPAWAVVFCFSNFSFMVFFSDPLYNGTKIRSIRVMGRFWNRTCRYRCRFFRRLSSRFRPVFLSQCHLAARFLNYALIEGKLKQAHLFYLTVDVHFLTAAVLKVGFFILPKSWDSKNLSLTQTTIVKNDIVFPTANFAPTDGELSDSSWFESSNWRVWTL